MAPQQNSTLIDNSLDVCPSPEEELKRFSPILPPKNQHQQQLKHHDNNNEEANDLAQLNGEQLPKKYQQLGPTDEYKQQTKRGENAGIVGRRSRSISLYGVNSTVEQGHKEIPIWLNDEPRYVSGVTNKTTCNDIIKALIDDEIRNGNKQFYGQRDGGSADVTTASRVYSDYVITESWRGIDRCYDGNMAILPVWRAWSRVHNELRLAMKHRKDIKDPLLLMPSANKSDKDKNNGESCTLLRYFKKLFAFGKRKHAKKQKEAIKNKTKEKCLIAHKAQIPDEFFFVILPDQLYEKNSKNDHLTTKSKNLKTSAATLPKLTQSTLYKLAETRASQRKRKASIARRRQRREQQRTQETMTASAAAAANNCIRRRKDLPLRSSLRDKLAQKNADMNALYEREYELTKQLTKKCRLYKLQNDLYTNPCAQMELSVGQIQRNIEQYADEIVKTEHELLELKNEIKHDISLINNLKRMTIDGSTTPTPMPKPQSMSTSSSAELSEKDAQAPENRNAEQMQFVDNIYEFCDNNASMLV